MYHNGVIYSVLSRVAVDGDSACAVHYIMYNPDRFGLSFSFMLSCLSLKLIVSGTASESKLIGVGFSPWVAR